MDEKDMLELNNGKIIEGSSGQTSSSKEFYQEHSEKLGKIKSFSYDYKKMLCYLTGDDGSMILTGFCNGSGGEGSCGLEWLMLRLKIPVRKDFSYVEDYETHDFLCES